MKEFNCKTCGETDPNNFYKGSKSKCKKCCSAEHKKNYVSVKKPRIEKPKIKKVKPPNNLRTYFSIIHKDSNGNVIKTYDNIMQAAIDFNYTLAGIRGKINYRRFLDDGSYFEYGEKLLQPKITRIRIITDRTCRNKEDFIRIVKKNHGDNKYSFEKTVYNGTTKPITVTCVKHNCDVTVKAETLLRRTEVTGGAKKNPVVGSCPKCREEYFAGIKEEMYQKFKRAHNNEYEYEEYVNMIKPFYAICKLHGRFKVTGYNHLAGQGKCPICYPTRRSSKNNENERWIDGKRFYACEIHGNVPIGKQRHLSLGCPSCAIIEGNKKIIEYKKKTIAKKWEDKFIIKFNDDSTVTLTCKKHNEIHIKSLNELSKTSKHICNTCREDAINANTLKQKERASKTKLEVIDKVKKIIKDEYDIYYEFLEFIDCSNTYDYCKVKLYNKMNDKIRTVLVTTILNKWLSKNHRFILRNYVDYEEAKRRVRALGITSFREYKKWYKRTQQTELPTNPQRHYKEWTSYCDFFGTNPYKNMSWGEKRILIYLQRKKIKYVWQKRFDDCRNKNPLPYDFYLPDYNMIIEFDGEQHYTPTLKFGKHEFEKTQINDKIKNEYCRKNNIHLLRIHYDDLINNVLEWSIDTEISRITVESILSEK